MQVRCIGEQVYIGYGQQIAAFSPQTAVLASHSPDRYFGHLYAAHDGDTRDLAASVLVASASELLHSDSAGQTRWRTGRLGVDGVVVRAVQRGQISDEGE